jgi:hypothetical protein
MAEIYPTKPERGGGSAGRASAEHNRGNVGKPLPEADTPRYTLPTLRDPPIQVVSKHVSSAGRVDILLAFPGR